MERDVVLFDLDGTLVDSASGIATALNVLRAERGGAPLRVSDVRPLVALGAEELVARGLAGLVRDPVDDLARFRACLRALPADRADLFTGVGAMLESLAGAGWRSAIVTNKPERLSRLLLTGLGLAGAFEAIVGGDSASACKPDPAPIDMALALLDSRRERAIFVGDTVVDAAAARRAGLPFLLFLGGYGADGCAAEPRAATFASHADVPGLLTRWQ